jgi:hypothetical protein
MFCSKIFVPSVCSWYFDYNDQNTHVILIRKYKVKWWDYFKVENKSFKYSGKWEFIFSSSSALSSLGSYTPLSDENEDDCYDILPSLQNP